MDANHSSRTERRCLYRRTPGRRATSREHFLPESFGHGHPFVLRIGVVCDACNRWAARKLDPSLLRVGMQALDLFFHGVRGKRGELKRFDAPGIALDPVAGTARFSKPGESAEAMLRWHDFYARALHKVALGALAQRSGTATACDSAIDPVARYIRQGGAFRPYAHALGRWSDREVHLAFDVVGKPSTIVRVGIQISTQTFWVMLAGPLAELDGIPVPVVRTVRTRDHSPSPDADQAIVLEGAGVASLHRVPAGPLAAVIPSLHLYPEIQSFRMDAPRWRPDSKQAPP